MRLARPHTHEATPGPHAEPIASMWRASRRLRRPVQTRLAAARALTTEPASGGIHLPNLPGADQDAQSMVIVPPTPSAARGPAAAAEGNAADQLLLRYLRMGSQMLSKAEHGASDGVAFDMEGIAKDGHRFNAEFSANPASPTPFAGFARHYYAMPRPECLVPALVSLLGSPRGLAGEGQMSEALFFGRALGQLGEAAVPLGMLMMRVVDEVGTIMVTRASSEKERMLASQMQMSRREGMLLALLHSEVPELAAVVEQGVKQAEAAVGAVREGRVGPDGAPVPEEEREAACLVVQEAADRLRCFLPADAALRTPMQPLTWPLPGLPYEEAAFFDGAVGNASPPWAKSSRLVTLALTVRDRGGEDGRGMDADTWARVGLAVGEAVQDAMWSEVHASADVMTLRKCVAAAAEWIAYADEHGPEHVLDPEGTPVPMRFTFEDAAAGEVGGDAAASRDDPRERMRFQLARRAMARLIREASQHPMVVEAMELERRDLMHLMATASLRGSAGPRSTVSASAKQAATAIESTRPLLHMALAEGRAAVPQYAALFAQRLEEAFARELDEDGAELERLEPLLGDDTGVVPPAGLLAMAWHLPPMVAEQWAGQDTTPQSLRDGASSTTNDLVMQAVARTSQTGRVGFMTPARPRASASSTDVDAEASEAVAAAAASCGVRVDWSLATSRANTLVLEGQLAHRLFEVTRRARESEGGGGVPVGGSRLGSGLPPGAESSRA